MENDTEFQRLRAENIGLSLKIKDLENLLEKAKRNFDQLYTMHKSISESYNRAVSMLESYAEFPGSNLLGKLDAKLELFFPLISERVKKSRARKRKDNIRIVDSKIIYGHNNPDLDIRIP